MHLYTILFTLLQIKTSGQDYILTRTTVYCFKLTKNLKFAVDILIKFIYFRQ